MTATSPARGLVISSSVRGDATLYLVDEEMWAQISNVVREHHDRYLDEICETVGWLVCDEPEVVPPDGAPEKKGKVVQRIYTQRGVLEACHQGMHLLGVLALPG